MKPAPLMAAAAGLLLMCSIALAGGQPNRAGAGHHTKRPAHSVHRAPRVYNASNFPTRSYSRKASSFVPRPRATAAHAVSQSPARATRKASKVTRNSQGPAARSSKAREEFRQDHPCPSTGWTTGSCPGYVIDHIKAAHHGGADTPSNLRWQTTDAAKAKDGVE